MHKAIEAVTVRDLAIVEFEPNDLHCRFIRSTPMLTALAKEYSTLLPELGDGRGADSGTTNPLRRRAAEE